MMKFKYPAAIIALALGGIPARGDENKPSTTFTKLGQNSYRLDWTGGEGWTVIPQFSTNLVDWFYMSEIDQGEIHDPIDVTPLDQFGQPYPKFFMRLKMDDTPTLDPKNADFDGDGLSNWEELTIYGTDPFKADTLGTGFMDGQTDLDGDGLPDQWEQAIIDNSPDPSALTIEDIEPNDDFDGDGLSNLREFQLGLNPYLVDSDGDGYGDRLSADRNLHLRLDEEAGTVAADESGHGRNGALVSSPAWQPVGGIDQGALDFDGSGDAVTLPADVFDGGFDLTISLWFRTSENPAAQTLLSAAHASQASELSVGLENGHTIRFHQGGGNSTTWNAGRNLADGLWHHVVIVRNVTSGNVSLYLDGTSSGSPHSATFGSLQVDAAVLGQHHQTVSSYDATKAFTGKLDDVRVYSVVLDPEHAIDLFRPNDLDRDGLPDDWEQSLFGNLATLASADDDLDGDGASNRDEYESGTNPGDYYNGTTPVVTLVSGSGQTIYNGSRTADPLVFQVTDGTNPLVNAPVELSHLELIGGIETLDGDTLATALTLRTDSEGKVAVHFKAD